MNIQKEERVEDSFEKKWRRRRNSWRKSVS